MAIKQRGYRFAVSWIALNDEPTILDAREVADFISTQLVADTFCKSPDEVAQDVVRYRKNHSGE